MSQIRYNTPIIEMALHHVDQAKMSTSSSDVNGKNIATETSGDRTSELQTLAAISAELKQAEGADELASIFLREILTFTGGFCSTFYRADQQQETVDLWQGYPTETEGQRRLPLVNEMLDSIANAEEPLFLWGNVEGRDAECRDVETFGHRGRGDVAYSQEAGNRIVLLPMLTTQGQFVGILLVELDQHQTLVEEEVAILKSVVTMAADVLNRASTMDTLENLVEERTKELTAANTRLLELDKLKNKFIEDISHEFRTPLTSISLYLSLLEKEVTEKGNRHIDALKRQTTQLTQLVSAVLDISKPERVTGVGEFDKVDLGKLVAEVVAVKEPYASTLGIGLSWEEAKTVHVYGNMGALQRLVSNLLDNAINYTPDGTITLSVEVEGSEVCIRVDDTGLGIPRNEFIHIFDRFYRGAAIGQLNIPGSGLGLSMVKQIAENHNGRVEVESELGQGSTFRVWMPLMDDGAAK